MYRLNHPPLHPSQNQKYTHPLPPPFFPSYEGGTVIVTRKKEIRRTPMRPPGSMPALPKFLSSLVYHLNPPYRQEYLNIHQSGFPPSKRNGIPIHTYIATNRVELNPEYPSINSFIRPNDGKNQEPKPKPKLHDRPCSFLRAKVKCCKV